MRIMDVFAHLFFGNFFPLYKNNSCSFVHLLHVVWSLSRAIKVDSSIYYLSICTNRSVRVLRAYTTSIRHPQSTNDCSLHFDCMFSYNVSSGAIKFAVELLVYTTVNELGTWLPSHVLYMLHLSHTCSLLGNLSI